MDIILAEAEKRGMKVWLLDDDKFPTGHAAGWIAKRYPELRQWELVERHIDVVGPASDVSIIFDREDEANILNIIESEDNYTIKFIKNEDKESWSYPHIGCAICFCNSGSRIPRVEQLFMRMFNYLAYECELVECEVDEPVQ